MAFGKRGWRRYTVEDRVYYWQAPDFDYEGPRANLLFVRPEFEPYRLLTVRNACCGQHVDGRVGAPVSGVTRGCVKSAVASGWLADRPKLVLVVLFTDPPRHVILNPSWLTSTVVALAEGISADNAFDRLPILADALQDAGCEDADLLGHLRGDGPHVRGCWALDLVLGKE